MRNTRKPWHYRPTDSENAKIKFAQTELGHDEGAMRFGEIDFVIGYKIKFRKLPDLSLPTPRCQRRQ
jgi:hypothetical protein